MLGQQTYDYYLVKKSLFKLIGQMSVGKMVFDQKACEPVENQSLVKVTF
jgi:hypothetical protein